MAVKPGTVAPSAPSRASPGPILNGKIIALDVETTGLDPYKGGARIFCWAYMTELGEFGYMDKTPENLQWVANLLQDPTRQIIFHNAKFDLKMFLVEGIPVLEAKAKIHCTMVLAKMFRGQLVEYSLLGLSRMFLRRDPADKIEVTQWLKANRKQFVKDHGRTPNFSDAPREVVKRRCLWDVESTLYLFRFFHPRVQNICPKLYETERQLLMVVVDMEHTGIRVDITHAKKLKAISLQGIDQLQNELNELVCPLVVRRACCLTPKCKRRKGIKVILYDSDMPESCPACGGTDLGIKEEVFDTINPGSSAIQLPVAFIKMGIGLKYKTKPKKAKKGKKASMGGRWSFDEYAMRRYVSPAIASIIKESGEEGWPLPRFHKALHDAVKAHKLPTKELLPPLILKLTEMKKMVSTYYNHIIDEAVDIEVGPNGRETGILHCSFNQSEADTGRFSCSGPNMQNMPRILGPRECFIPRKGRRNWHLDYKQVEMKFFVHFAKDRKMAAAIDSDIHLHVAAECYGLPIDQVTSEQRKKGKQINFGIIYGASPPKIAETLTRMGVATTVGESTLLVARYHKRFPTVRRLTNELKVQLFRQKFITNPFGRRYYLPTERGYAGLNYMCQGTSADLMKQRMVRVWQIIREHNFKAKILLTVHDELGIEIPPCEQKVLVPLIKQAMEELDDFFVPITVDVEVVTKRWSQKESPETLGVAA